MYKQVAYRMRPFTALIPSYQRQIKPTPNLTRSDIVAITTTARQGIITCKQGTITLIRDASSMRTH